MTPSPVIEHYSQERIPNPHPDGSVSWQLYHTVRNSVLRCCRDFGIAGAMGECPISDDEGIDYLNWPVENRKPLDFYVCDDQYNSERYVYVEVENARVFTEKWLQGLMRTIAEYPGWGIGIKGLRDGYILVFADKLMVAGPTFGHCNDIVSVVRAGKSSFVMGS